MKTDSLFYRLFQRMPELLLELAGLEITADGYRFYATEVKQTAFRLDGVLLPPEQDSERPCIFSEVQFQPDDSFYPRFFSEIFLYLRQHAVQRPWCAVVIYPDRATERAAPPAFQPLLNLAEVKRVYLEDCPKQASGALGLIALIVCPKELAGEQAQRVAAQTAPPLPPDEWLNFIETILVYKLPQLTREEIKEMIGIQDIDLKQTRFYQDVFAEGQQEGRQEGRREGRQEGKQEGEMLVLKRILERKFGPLSAALQSRLEQADAETLLLWSERIWDARSADEVFTPQSH
jgi:predicted transposase/invertase (TIGR01784 family)